MKLKLLLFAFFSIMLCSDSILFAQEFEKLPAKRKGQPSVRAKEPVEEPPTGPPQAPPRRMKIYYPDMQIDKNLYTKGGEWMTADDKVEYKGYYHKYTTGEVYTRKDWDPVYSRKLKRYIP
jgi:hypothetical protein